MRKILFLIPNLDCGGSERVFVHLMNNLDRERFSIQLALLRKRGVFLNELRGDITVHELHTNLAGAFFRVPSCIEGICPDIVFSTICYLNIVVGFSRRFVRHSPALWLARESGMPSIRGKVAKSVWNARWFYRASYRHIDYIICQSNEMRDDVHDFYHVPLSKIVTINNPVDVDDIKEKARTGEAAGFVPGRINVLTVGRMNPVKGYDMLLRAWARTTNPRLHLHIIAGGTSERYEKLAAELGIAGRVTFHGFKANPYPYMRAADLFVLSSRYEGFPNALVEALALGCPAVSFTSPGGINELIEDGINGFSVPLGNVDALAREMDLEAYLNLDRERISEKASAKYDIKTIVGRYEDLLEKCAAVP